MDADLDRLIAQLEAYIQDARTQIGIDAARESYWRGVLFGLELALLEARADAQRRTAQATPEQLPTQPEPAAPDEFYSAVNKLVFEHVGKLITLCEARIKRELLVYNAKTTRYELLNAIRHAARVGTPSEAEARADPDNPAD